MAIVDIFSKRQKRLRGELPDVYQYEYLPDGLKVQTQHILKDILTYYDYDYDEFQIYQGVCANAYNQLCREYGVLKLNYSDTPSDSYFNYFEALFEFLLNGIYYEKNLDVVELLLQTIIEYYNNGVIKQNPKHSIEELNSRFQEHGVGYRFESGYIIKIDSEFTHSEIIKPSLLFLSEPEFKGANQEFLNAHEHYRFERYKECLNECLKSLESVLKIIFEKKGWSYDQKDTANKLVEKCFEKQLIPKYLQSSFSGLQSILKSGVNTIRNNESGHGQGSSITEVPEYLASYTLNLTASSILFLVKASN